MNQEKLMKQVTPGEMHAIVASRVADGAVGLFYARDPITWLAAIGAHCQIDQAEVRPAAAAAKVIERLRAKFSATHIPSAALPWYLIDHDQAVAALDEINMATGELLRDLQPRSPVMLFPSRSRGHVLGFTRGGQVVVKLDAPRFTTNLVIAPRESVKPVIRRMPA